MSTRPMSTDADDPTPAMRIDVCWSLHRRFAEVIFRDVEEPERIAGTSYMGAEERAAFAQRLRGVAAELEAAT